MRDEFMIMRQGKQYVLYQGLLDEAHARGLRGIDTDLVQVPTAENNNVALVKAVVEMEPQEGSSEPKSFSGLGDASPENVGRNIVPHIIRMAETRAKARALRDAVNVGATSLEELSDADADSGTGGQSRSQSSQSGGQSSQSKGQSNVTDLAEKQGEAKDATQPAQQDAKQGARGTRKGSGQKARKSQVDLLRTLAEELRGENGVQRLESRIGKSLGELTRAEADEWIDRLTPAEGRGNE